VSVSLLATCLGLFAARAATRYRFPAKAGIMGFIMLPLVLPEVIVAISLLVVLMQLGLESGGWSIILGHTLLCIPFSIAILQGSFSNMDQSLEEAADRPRRDAVLDLPADHPAAGRAGDRRVAADLFHDLARRVHHRVFPVGQCADAAGLPVGTAAVSGASADDHGAGHHPRGAVDPVAHRRRDLPAPRLRRAGVKDSGGFL
jgi:hypothetical protein